MNEAKVKLKLTISQSLNKGDRKYMEDFCCNHIEKNNENAVFGIFGIFSWKIHWTLFVH